MNSYDNALLYTDHFLTQTLKLLQTQSTHDAALLYVSDHGESLGEKGIYLHGIPYRIAPKEQTQVPMVLWLSDNFAKQMQINVACIRTKNQEALSHDYLFHSVLGMLNVQTKIHDANYDFSYSCRVK